MEYLLSRLQKPETNSDVIRQYSTLSNDDVRTIRAEFLRGETQVALAQKFNVTPTAVHCIVRYKTHANLI